MAKNEGLTVTAAEKQERAVGIGTLAVGAAFRVQGVSFEQALGGDDAGGCFYRVMAAKKDRLVRVLSLDCAIERLLPEETLVHPHHITIKVHPTE